MDWTSRDDFKQQFAVMRQATHEEVDVASELAVDDLVELVGQSAVDDALLASPTDEVRAARIVRGHKMLALSIHYLNARTIKREQDAGSPAMNRSFQVQNEYFSTDDRIKLSEAWRARALRTLASYLIADVEGDSYGGGFEYSHPETDACGDICGGATQLNRLPIC